MTTEAASAVMVPSRPAWRSLLWFAPLTALWILLIYRWPAIPAGGIPTTAHQLAAHGLIALGSILLHTLSRASCAAVVGPKQAGHRRALIKWVSRPHPRLLE